MSQSDTTQFQADYPFARHVMEVGGGRMHYVDQGKGPTVVLVHGTPTWSYLYRHVIGGLATQYRVIAPDLLGYGRSDKSPSADYRPAAQARYLTQLLEALGVENFVLGVHDYGGPIGLSYALARPSHVRGLILFNTWMWSLAGTSAERISRFMGGALGRFLYTRLNFSPRVLLKMAYGDRRKLTRQIHRRYLEPFASSSQRMAPWVLARELAGSSDWYEQLWSQRQALAEKPALLLWGMKDPAFGTEALARWKSLLPDARVVTLQDAGHFVQEEAPECVEREIRRFLQSLDGMTRKDGRVSTALAGEPTS